MPSNIERTLKLLRSRDLLVEKVEKWNEFSKVRHDLFNIIDILAVSTEEGIVGVQVCGGSSHAEHKTKILAEPKTKSWLLSGGKLFIYSWSKRKAKLKNGAFGKSYRWTSRIEQITLDTLNFSTPSYIASETANAHSLTK